MNTSLAELYSEHKSTFKLCLLAGQLNGQNIVDWIYMLEDETIIPFMQGGALIVTTGVRQMRKPEWLRELVEELIKVRASGLIVNVGMYIRTIPQDVVDLCKASNFPLITMPWEMRITEMTQTLCMTIINNQQENLLHDRAMYEAILHPENEDNYWERLGVYYDLKGDFTIVNVYAKDREEVVDDIFLPPRDMEYRMERKIRGLMPRQTDMKISWIQMERLQVFIVNRAEKDTIASLVSILKKAYDSVKTTHKVYIGVGTMERGVRGISESYRNAMTALKMAEIRREAAKTSADSKQGPSGAVSVCFRDMGMQRLLMSCRNESIPRNYADELLAPIDAMGSKAEEYLELLDCYIRHDRSLEGTAEEMFLHRNTVNYRIRKLREALDNPLKTVDDLVPYRLALSIRGIGLSSQDL